LIKVQLRWRSKRSCRDQPGDSDGAGDRDHRRLIGGGALGSSTWGFTKPNLKMGDGVAAGVSIVLLAMILDRLHPGMGNRSAPENRNIVNVASNRRAEGENMRTRIHTPVRSRRSHSAGVRRGVVRQ
jgi:hypothetical protein